jgi:alkaline phosphatase D
MNDLLRILPAIERRGQVDRRLFLAYLASLAAIPSFGLRRSAHAASDVKLPSDPFRLGIASGDPTDSGVVLWTRLAPEPLEPHGGMPPSNVAVTWQVATDESMKDVVRAGSAPATPELGHSVHVEVDGLTPDRWYWYRFRAGDAESPIGRTRTLPNADAMPDKLRFAFASCQNFEHGLYTAYQHMAEEDLDLVFHLGDYIYEDAATDRHLRRHLGGEAASLDDYRLRYALYKSDPLLQAAHAHFPWIVTWDDHEVQDNYANDRSSRPNVSSADFLVRRAAAYQAYYEMMPLRATSLPNGSAMQIYRTLAFGQLAQFCVLDTRQFRSDQPNGDGERDIVGPALNHSLTMLGERQRKWLGISLKASTASWNVLAQSVMMAMVDVRPGEKLRYDMDQWPGCVYEREQLIQFLERRKIRNPVVLSGDIHENFVNDLRVDDRQADTPVVATEFVGTSISSGGNGAEKPEHYDPVLAENPCVRFYNGERGYVRCTLTPKLWRSDYRVVTDISHPGAPIVDRASFVVEDAKAGAVRA